MGGKVFIGLISVEIPTSSALRSQPSGFSAWGKQPYKTHTLLIERISPFRQKFDKKKKNNF